MKIIDANKSNLSKYVTDVVIVGAGLSGIYLAKEFKDKDLKILLIDRGNTRKNFSKENRTENIGIFHQSSQNQSNFILGGHTNNWGGQLAEFEKIDFKKKYWGIDYKKIKKNYEYIYKDLGIFNNHFREKKKINSKLNYYRTIYLDQKNFIKKFESEFELQENISLIKNLIVSDLKIENNIVKKIISKNFLNQIIEIEAKVFVFSMGTFENIRFFLNQKRKNKIFNDLCIGKFFQDHIGIHFADVNIIDGKKFRNLYANQIQGNFIVRNKISNFRNSINQLGISGEFVEKSNKNFFQYKEILKNLKKKKIENFFKILKDFKNYDLLFEFLREYYLNQKVYSFYNNKAVLYIQSEQKSIIESKAFLSSKLLKDGLPKMKLNWQLGDNEYFEILDFANQVNQYLISNHLGSLRINISNKKHFLEKIIDTNHPSGGLIISSSPRLGFCDSSQKIWNIKNAYVNGPCIYPNSSYANVGLNSLVFSKLLAKNINNSFRQNFK
jgi:hypothetical protein